MSENEKQQPNHNHHDVSTRLSKVEVRQEGYERDLQRLHTDLKDVSHRQVQDMKDMSVKQDKQHKDMINHIDSRMDTVKDDLIKQIRLWVTAVGVLAAIVFSGSQYINSQSQLNAQQVYEDQQAEQQK